MRTGASDGADPDRSEPEHLDDAEDAGEHVVGNGSLDERERGDVDERVSDAEEREEHERERRPPARARAR